MKRFSWLLLLAFIFTLVFGFTTPVPATVTAMPIISLDNCAADHFAPTAANYIGNSNSGKFHYASCTWVGKMNPGNKVYFETRQEAVNAGYVPCKVCKP